MIHADRMLDADAAHGLYMSDSDINLDNDYSRQAEDVAENNDKQFLSIFEWYGHLRHRESALGVVYPFNVETNSNVIHAKEALTDHQKLYVLLLMSSSLGCLTYRLGEFCLAHLRQFVLKPCTGTLVIMRW